MIGHTIKIFTPSYLGVKLHDVLSRLYAQPSRHRLNSQELRGGDDFYPAGLAELVKRQQLAQVHLLLSAHDNGEHRDRDGERIGFEKKKNVTNRQVWMTAVVS